MFGLSNARNIFRQGSRLGDYFPAWVRETFFGQPIAQRVSLEEALSGPDAKGGAYRHLDIVLPDSFLLSRNLPSPPKTRGNWHSFAELDLIRQTPFKVDQVHWVLTCHENLNDRTLTQWIAKRSEIDSISQRLASKGIRPLGFYFRTPNALELLTNGDRRRSGLHKLWPRLNAFLVFLIVSAACFIWLAPAWEAKIRADKLELEFSALQEEALSLRAELDGIRQIDAERTDFLDSLARNPRVVTQLRESTVVLPDTAWLNEWRYFRGQLRLSGEVDGSAADLVLMISEQSPRWAPALAGAVSRTPEGKERFDIDITLGRSTN